jgi:hypothetical protein
VAKLEQQQNTRLALTSEVSNMASLTAKSSASIADEVEEGRKDKTCLQQPSSTLRLNLELLPPLSNA